MCTQIFDQKSELTYFWTHSSYSETKKEMSEIEKFCQAISGKWIQTGNENMDAINAGSNMSWATRKVANMMTVRLQVSTPNPNQVFMSFQTKLKNMDLQLNYAGVTDHLGLADEVSAWFKYYT